MNDTRATDGKGDNMASKRETAYLAKEKEKHESIASTMLAKQHSDAHPEDNQERTINKEKNDVSIRNQTNEEAKIDGRRNPDVNGAKYEKSLTVSVELSGEEAVTTMDFIKAIRLMCGGITACRTTGTKTYEVTMSSEEGKERLMDGFKFGDTEVQGKSIANNEMVVSFLNLPAYIADEDILDKLEIWGVRAISTIRRRMWPGTKVADGTRFVKVRFTDKVQSLPYSAKFNTAIGQEYFRVIHDRQVRVCRLCIQPGHILRECPDFVCFQCGMQGHYARECNEKKSKCKICFNTMERCICNYSNSEMEQSEADEVERNDLDETVSAEVETDIKNYCSQQYGDSDTRRERTRKMGPTPDQVDGLTEKWGDRKMVPAMLQPSRARPSPKQTQDSSSIQKESLQSPDNSKGEAESHNVSSDIPDPCVSHLSTQDTMSLNVSDFPPLSSTAKPDLSDSSSEMDLSEVTPLRKRQNARKLKREKKKSKNKLTE